MNPAPSPFASARPVAVLIVLALAPLWCVGMLDRGLWTPDEPREADIAWRMSLQSDRTLPQLAGTPFLEKPPLSYWMSAGTVALLGDYPAAARAPNLLYALVTALAIGALMLLMRQASGAAVIAALVAGSALTAYRVAIWLAPDACLLAGCALSLLGAWCGYQARPGARKAGGYALMHVGAAIGLMAKSAPGWLVPALALLSLIAWERRWSELSRWELYAGLILQALIIGPWLAAVASGAQGAEALRVLFWNNVVGRFTPVAAPAPLDYTSGHHNTPGKYLLELPVYLLPWTLLVAAALRRAWSEARVPGPSGTAWRFALGSSVPFLVLLSFAATARDIYAAPALLGLALLTGLWAVGAQSAQTPLDHLALRWTRVLVGALACLTIAALAILSVAGAGWCSAVAIAVFAAAFAALARAARTHRAGHLQRSLVWTYGAWAATVCLAALAAFPVIDRWQNLSALARRIHEDTAREPLALLDPDETTIAMLDRGLATPVTVLTTAEQAPERALAGWFARAGTRGRVLVLLPGHAEGKLTRLIERVHPFAPPGDGVAARLEVSGVAVLERRYELPQGRRYALLGPPAK